MGALPLQAQFLDSSGFANSYMSSLDNAYVDTGAIANTDVLVASTRPPAQDVMRAYRACLNCRSRKSRCDLNANNGIPPCRRCQRGAHKCTLGESHRGGRRVKRKPNIDNSSISISPSRSQTPTAITPTSSEAPQSPSFHLSYEMPQAQALAWPPRISPTPASSDPTLTQLGSQRYEEIASAALQNPSDALEILAQVADRAIEREHPRDEARDNQGEGAISASGIQEWSIPKMDEQQLHYKPVQDGLLAPEMVYHLFSSYEKFFHPYFPIIPRETFDQTRLSWLSRHEPHLFSAILTIASKDNEPVHQVCYDYMQQLISMILAGSGAKVEAVEAMLLLSQWVSHRPQAEATVGRGEEDRVAWMYTGMALRLGYFLGLDCTSFKDDCQEDTVTFSRKKLAWAACYICDRQVSVRLGKGFWSRGPGPLSGLQSDDFPTLQPSSPIEDNWALIFQANLELTQIFNNVYDILYSSKGHGWKEMLEGRYTKYLDDFRTSIRNWNDTWGTLTCSAHLKASLLLTYDYLRLYANAFAYQATISRSLMFRIDRQYPSHEHLPPINASAPDARFIYEAVDAAKSLLLTFINFDEPEAFRYMPSSYYLFIIYSAVFLYKARYTTTMTAEEQDGVCLMIDQTIYRLQQASMGVNHMGSRYARLIQLLWSKAPMPTCQRKASISQPMDGPLSQQYTESLSIPANFDSDQDSSESTELVPNRIFSWLDLGATWDFATQNNSIGGGTSGDGFANTRLNLLDTTGMMIDYSYLYGDNPNLIF